MENFKSKLGTQNIPPKIRYAFYFFFLNNINLESHLVLESEKELAAHPGLDKGLIILAFWL